MRKLGRIVRRVLTAVSLLLFVAVLAAWVRGYWQWGEIDVLRKVRGEQRAETYFTVEWGRGTIVARRNFVSFRMADRGQASQVSWEWSVSELPVQQADYTFALRRKWPSSPSVEWGCGGVHMAKYESNNGYSNATRHVLGLPCWMAAIVFGALPSWRGIVWWRGVRGRRVASREGRCGMCGYDLRASPERCPECGTGNEKREAGREGEHPTLNIEHPTSK